MVKNTGKRSEEKSKYPDVAFHLTTIEHFAVPRHPESPADQWSSSPALCAYNPAGGIRLLLS